jgi:hypothetical protein
VNNPLLNTVGVHSFTNFYDSESEYKSIHIVSNIGYLYEMELDYKASKYIVTLKNSIVGMRLWGVRYP